MTINVIVVLILVGGWFMGKLFNWIRLPHVLGMLFCGIIIGLLWRNDIPGVLWQVEPFLKSMALIIILLRAGLGINKETLQKAGLTALLMSLLPCIMEGFILTILFHFIFKFNWYVSGLTAFMLAAVSPAVIVPSMLDLKSKGYGKKNEVPTIVLAGASVDDVFAITLFSVFLGLSLSKNVNIIKSLLSIPVSIITGVIPGIIVGFLLVFSFKKGHKYIRATEKSLLLLTSAMLLVQIGNWMHSAALLGVMTIGFIILEKAENIAGELASKFAKAWIFAEIILFVLIGISVDLKVALDAGLKGILIVTIGLVFRSVGVVIATSFSKLSIKERLFCVIAYIPKATVQAALGSVALTNGLAEGNIILALAVLSIIFTAPLGLIGIKIAGPRLLDLEFPKYEEI